MGSLQARILNTVAQLVKNPPAMQTWVHPWVGKIWRRERYPLQHSGLEEFHGVEKSWDTTEQFSGFPGRSEGKESACNEGDLGLIPGLGRSPGGGHGNPLQHFCLKNSHEQTSLEC